MNAPMVERLGYRPNRITFDNPSPYHLDVEVSSGPHEGWMALGTVERDGQTDVNKVYDLGDVWLLRYSAQGQVSGIFRLTRAELTKDNWHVQVPEAVVAELHATNVAPEP